MIEAVAQRVAQPFVVQLLGYSGPGGGCGKKIRTLKGGGVGAAFGQQFDVILLDLIAITRAAIISIRAGGVCMTVRTAAATFLRGRFRLAMGHAEQPYGLFAVAQAAQLLQGQTEGSHQDETGEPGNKSACLFVRQCIDGLRL